MRSLSGTAAHTAVSALRHEGGFQPEIQGLRAFAVLVVVCAHAGLAGFAGGFIGVDVFFVISGFLITRLLLAEFAETGRIDLLAFWARRARRLLPNAYACLLGTLLLALLLFPGYDPASLAREVGFSALQYVNYYFADKAVDYFQSDTPASPVLHFWSPSRSSSTLSGRCCCWESARRSRTASFVRQRCCLCSPGAYPSSQACC
jgi:peptidoglycan/LPS O-acetylase OafA/YrhL